MTAECGMSHKHTKYGTLIQYKTINHKIQNTW